MVKNEEPEISREALWTWREVLVVPHQEWTKIENQLKFDMTKVSQYCIKSLKTTNLQVYSNFLKTN
jgi:hypothetical protein